MDHNDSLWVDRRLESLAPPAGWQPDTNAALARFQSVRREAAVTSKRRIWFAFAVAGAAACLAAAVLAPRLLPAPAERARHIVPAAFRETGSPDAPLLAEIYSDYQCGHCARFYLETVPLLMTDYVATGKLRLLHRDLPLPQHPYARLAARYANAAGRLGRYQAAVEVLFRSQPEWTAAGDIDAQLAPALTPADMQRVRQAVRGNHDLDASIDEDIRMARVDDVRETPTMVVVANGRRHSVAPVPPYPLLKSYLDELLKANCRENPSAAQC